MYMYTFICSFLAGGGGGGGGGRVHSSATAGGQETTSENDEVFLVISKSLENLQTHIRLKKKKNRDPD